jgi:hypothetical protein
VEHDGAEHDDDRRERVQQQGDEPRRRVVDGGEVAERLEEVGDSQQPAKAKLASSPLPPTVGTTMSAVPARATPQAIATRRRIGRCSTTAPSTTTITGNVYSNRATRPGGAWSTAVK